MFPYIEAKEALKSNFSYLTPQQAPFYWILIALSFYLYRVSIELPFDKWLVSFFVAAIFSLACVFYSLRHFVESTSEQQVSQLRIARIVGITTPFLSFAFVVSRVKLDSALFFISLGVTLFHCAVYLFAVKDKPKDSELVLNIPQVLVVCTALLFSTQATVGSLATRSYISKLPETMFFGYGKEEVDTSPWTEDEYRTERYAKFAIKAEAGPFAGGIYGLSYDLGAQPGIHKRYFEDARFQVLNLKLSATFEALLWSLCLIRITLYSVYPIRKTDETVFQEEADNQKQADA